MLAAGAALTICPFTGCIGSPEGVSQGKADIVWGKYGFSDGQFRKPRAVTIDAKDQIYVVDMTARIQVFDTDGNYLRHWQTPESKNGRPTGLSVGPDGNIWVADTHYFQALCYTPQGEHLKEKSIVGGPGIGPGQFGMLTEVTHDSKGRIYIGEYGENDRVQVFNPDGSFFAQVGSHGTGTAEFLRPQAISIDQNDRLWVADSGNHRFQIFSIPENGKPVLEEVIGQSGTGPGQLNYPYDFFFEPDGSIWVCEFGNSRVQKLDPTGKPLFLWRSKVQGLAGVHQPWGMVKDSKNRLHVLDSYHHRVFRIVLT